jgi:hypothetical protein
MARFRWKPRKESPVAWILAALLSFSLGFQAAYLLTTTI